MLSAYHTSFVPARIEIDTRSPRVTGVVIRMTDGGAVEGTLTLNGEPLANRRVAAYAAGIHFPPVTANENGTERLFPQPQTIVESVKRVDERVLRARGAWDPPWKRERKARGPPLELEGVFSFSPSSPVPDEFSHVSPSAEECSQERAETEDEFNQLPPCSDDEI